jgi:hypothetical protein
MIYKVGRSFLQPAKENLIILYPNRRKNQLLFVPYSSAVLDELRKVPAKVFPSPEVLLCGAAPKNEVSP